MKVIVIFIDVLVMLAKAIDMPISWMADKIDRGVWAVIYAYDEQKIKQRNRKKGAK